MPNGSEGPHVLGAHLEGPFLAPERLGTHPESARRDPDTELLERLLAAGPVRLVTLAPELPGADALIDLLHERGVTVSCGHTDANALEANAAFDLGVHTVTHLFNAMRPFNHRDPGIAGVALARDDVIVQVILDGHHLAPDTAKLVWNVGGGRVALVTDSMAGAGNGDGSYSLGGLEVEIRDGVARGPDGVLAGSSLTMIEAVRNLHSLGVPLADALDAATAVPSRIIGRPSEGLVAGARADVVVLDDNLGSTASSSGVSSVALPEPSPGRACRACCGRAFQRRDSRAACCDREASRAAATLRVGGPKAGAAPALRRASRRPRLVRQRGCTTASTPSACSRASRRCATRCR